MQEEPRTPIHPVVALHDEHGVIRITQEDTGVYGEDGTVTEEGLIIHRIYDLEEMADLGEFMQRYIWCNDLGWWKLVPEKPNLYAYWDGTLNPPAWNWDHNILVDDVKFYRTQKLHESDWTQVPDSPLTTEQKAAWAIYRQELRDLPANLTGEEITVEDAPWPTPPRI